jgi:KaiC/GvpD/RAD55 family RecA-like ATPase
MFQNYYKRKQAETNKKIFTASVLTAGVASLVTWLTNKDNRQTAKKAVNEVGTKLQEYGKEAEKHSSYGIKEAKNWVQDLASKITNSDKDKVTTVKVSDIKEKVQEAVEDIDISKNSNL